MSKENKEVLTPENGRQITREEEILCDFVKWFPKHYKDFGGTGHNFTEHSNGMISSDIMVAGEFLSKWKTKYPEEVKEPVKDVTTRQDLMNALSPYMLWADLNMVIDTIDNFAAQRLSYANAEIEKQRAELLQVYSDWKKQSDLRMKLESAIEQANADNASLIKQVGELKEDIKILKISNKLDNPDYKMMSDLGDNGIWIGKEYYNWGAYPIHKVKAMLKAQDLLLMNFTKLPKPF